MRNRIKVWIVDDNEEFGTVVAAFLGETRNVVCTKQCFTCEDAIAALERSNQPPDVILLDIGLPGMSGLQGLPAIKKFAPDARVIMLTVHDQDKNVVTALTSGADGYLLKSSSLHQIQHAIVTVVDEGMPMDPSVIKRVIRRMVLQRPTIENYDLSDKEQRILRLIVDGLTAKQIADQLSISYNTIPNYFKRIHRKLSVHSRAKLVAKAIKEHLV